MSLFDISDAIIPRAEKLGASMVECFLARYTTRSVYVDEGMPKLSDSKEEVGLGVKVAIGKRVAFGSSTLAEKDDAISILQETMRIARSSPEDPNFVSFPAVGKSAGRVEGAWDRGTATATADDLLEKSMRIVGIVKDSKDAQVPKGLIRAQDFHLYISNSLGVEASHKGTLAFLNFTSKVHRDGRIGEGVEKVHSTSLDAIDYEGVGTSLIEKAERASKARPFKGKMAVPTIMTPQELSEMLLVTIGFSLRGDNVNKKRSSWMDKLGGKVASETVTIQDRPRLRNGPMSAVVDDEGHPTKDKLLVEKGVLKSFVYNSYEASVAKCEAGNGYRRGVSTVEGCYANHANPSVSNLVVDKSSKDLDGLISELEEGLLVEKLATSEANPFSGSFGLEVRSATIIEKGELTTPVKHALLLGNVYDGLMNVLDVGRERAFGEAFVGSSGCAYLPPMVFHGFELVGSE